MKSSGIAMLAGPIKAWWDENWNTTEHWRYALWRERVNTELVKSYWLVYRPHEAFQGTWDERAQSINDFVLRTADVIINLTPPGVPSMGTDGEVLYAKNFDKPIIEVPAPERIEDFERALIELNQKLTDLGYGAEVIEQRKILDSLDVGASLSEIGMFSDKWRGHEKRFHYLDRNNHIRIIEGFEIPDELYASDLLKIEVLA